MLEEGFLDRMLDDRKELNAFRSLRLPAGMTDFCSNDYLGIATGSLIEKVMDRPQSSNKESFSHGSKGSRLLAGNYPLIEATEKILAVFHESDDGLIFNSGYDANVGLVSSVPQRGDWVLYDRLSHASLRDGVRLSFAHSQVFEHNDLADLEKKLINVQEKQTTGTSVANLFVITESVFSMDGDLAPLADIVKLCSRFRAHLIVDEAHATGIIGPRGVGLVQALGLQKECFARIVTFGKAVGCHGAIVLGSSKLRDFLINFSRAFIYSTALPPASIMAIRIAYEVFPSMDAERERLLQSIDRFQQADLKYKRLNSQTPIQAVIVPGNESVRALAAHLQTAGLDIRPILYPTVPKGAERLRIILHAFNTNAELEKLVACLT